LDNFTNSRNGSSISPSFLTNTNVSNVGQSQNHSEIEITEDITGLKNASGNLESEVEYKDSLATLYDSTIDSIVKITSYNINNQSDFKIGSGFIVDVNGTLSLLTSNNLVNDNDTATITLSDGDIYETQLKGYDPVTNIALLAVDEIPQDKLVSLDLANSTEIYVGQEVATIDSIEDYPNLLSNGIISGIEKSVPTFGPNVSNSLTRIPNGIITDISSHSNGYGGGPLLNIEGQVIGMNVQNHSSNIVVSPISYAIPSNSINKVVPKLYANGYYLHPWLGIGGTDVTPEIAKALKLEETRGFLVISVSPQSPAKLAGILGGENTTSINGRPITLGGDIILKIDNQDVQNIHEILSYVEDEKNVGDNVVVTVLRNGILQSINMNLQANPNFLPDTS
jgi:S1-C subfamily serine protease